MRMPRKSRVSVFLNKLLSLGRRRTGPRSLHKGTTPPGIPEASPLPSNRSSEAPWPASPSPAEQPDEVPAPDVNSVPAVRPKIPDQTPSPEAPNVVTSPHSPTRAAELRSTAYHGFKTGLGILVNVSGGFPPLKAAAGGLLDVLNLFNVRSPQRSLCISANDDETES